jgi:hypothetical protein
MDALYLKNNVYTALTEALASMAVALPDDNMLTERRSRRK